MLGSPKKVPFATALILDAVVQQAWPPSERIAKAIERGKVKVGELSGVAVNSVFEPTGLPEGIASDAADRALKRLRKELRKRLNWSSTKEELWKLSEGMTDSNEG